MFVSERRIEVLMNNAVPLKTEHVPAVFEIMSALVMLFLVYKFDYIQ